MNRLIPLFAALSILISLAIAAPVELKLKDGSVIKGDMATANAGERTDVVVTTDYGIVRVPVDKLTEETKTKLGIGRPLTPADYEARIRTLEAKVRALEDENARLRREVAGASPVPPAAAPMPAVSPRPIVPRTVAPTAPAPADAAAYTMSSTGKRHNSRCRYYGTGRACGPSDGVACKICGG
jgi:hypothetical protein